ncbi:nucleoside 2-deoxyribosyltransferase [Evansella halocellulosilytica]|uniref:nucleoside 2-deoxyribosyltransferase n=1 Tax=Evansella halocellulosilytica TaxID=2011013 RepID=UPI000BB79B92|nr:nucleoside 2-deoxyribosyltransferase [Evansella halocellulosilytica]
MKKKFYVASSFTNFEIVRNVARQLMQKGFLHTYDWTANDRADTIEKLKKIGQEEKEAVRDSDFIVIILPGGKGTHIELGIALGLNKRIYLYSPNEEINDPSISSTFYQLPEVNKFVGEINTFIEKVITEEGKHI